MSDRRIAQHRRTRGVGAATTAGAFLAFGMSSLVSAPSAQADFDFLDLLDFGDVAGDTADAATSVPDLSADGVAEALAATDTTGVSDIADSDPVLPGMETIPLEVQGDGALTQPVVNISIGDSNEVVPVAVDTGSAGLTIPIWDVPFQDIEFSEIDPFDLLGFKLFPAGLSVYLELPTTVNFLDGAGGEISTEVVSVDAVLFTLGLSPSASQALGGIEVDGFLGIGPNAAGGPGEIVTSFEDPALNEGVLIDEPHGLLAFGAKPDTVGGLEQIATLDGAPFVDNDLMVAVGDEDPQPVSTVIDSGGKAGWIPSSLVEDSPYYLDVLGGWGLLSPGADISVYAPDGETLLYSYTIEPTLGTAGGMNVFPNWMPEPFGGTFNTGNAAFADNPVYISNDDGGAMTFYEPSAG